MKYFLVCEVWIIVGKYLYFLYFFTNSIWSLRLSKNKLFIGLIIFVCFLYFEDSWIGFVRFVYVNFYIFIYKGISL